MTDMNSRAAIHESFVKKFHLGQEPKPLTDEELDSIEAELNTKLPVAFREFMARFGQVHTPGILDAVTAGDLDHPDIQDFLSAREAIANTKGYWSTGMPNDVIGVATDCMGNMIGFHRSHERREDAPVLFFDHDFITVSEIAPSFDDLLKWFLTLSSMETDSARI